MTGRRVGPFRQLARDLTPPAPLWVLIANACNIAALSAAIAPLWGHDPAHQGAVGCAVTLAVSVPVYAGYLVGRHSK